MSVIKGFAFLLSLFIDMWSFKNVIYGPRQATLVLIAYASSEGPGETARIQASLRIRAVSPEPSLLAHTSSESRETFRQKSRSLALLNGWACAVKICHDGMLEDTYSLDGAHIITFFFIGCKVTTSTNSLFNSRA